jgi:hypothetical protein
MRLGKVIMSNTFTSLATIPRLVAAFVVALTSAVVVLPSARAAPRVRIPEAASQRHVPPPIDFEHIVECDPPLFLGDPYTIDDQDTTRLRYSGRWKHEVPGRGLYRGTQHITNEGGSTVSYNLPSAPYQFAFGFTKMRNAGKAAVYFNNQYVTTIDMYAPVTDYNCVLWLYWGVPKGTFTVKALNQRNPVSSGTYVNIDYIHFEP